MPTINIDENAKSILDGVREDLKKRGIARPSYGDAVRVLYKED